MVRLARFVSDPARASVAGIALLGVILLGFDFARPLPSISHTPAVAHAEDVHEGDEHVPAEPTAAASTPEATAETTATTRAPATESTATTIPDSTPTTTRGSTPTTEPSATIVPAPTLHSATATARPAPTRTAVGAAPGSGVPILMYHYIRVNPDPTDRVGYGLSITPALFAAHMEFLAERGFRAITMRELVQQTEAGSLPAEKSVVVTFDDGYRDAFLEAWPVLRRLGHRATIFMISGLVGNHRYLTPEQLRELDAAGIEIGSHTINHLDLTSLGADKREREIGESRRALESIVGRPIVSFCYPSGRHNTAVRTTVKTVGYTSAVTVENGIFRGREDRFAIPRIRIYGGMGLQQFAASLGEPAPDRTRWAQHLLDTPMPTPRKP